MDGGGNAFRVGGVRPLFEVRAFRPGTIYDLTPDGGNVLINERLTDLDTSRMVLVLNWPGSLMQ